MPDLKNPLECPPLPDLTAHIVRIKDRYSAGGSFGDVYKCLYCCGPAMPTEVAVKSFRFSSTIDGEAGHRAIKMLRRELGIWRRLKHKNIVPFLGVAYGFGMDGAMSLVSSWMPNQSVHLFLAKHDGDLVLGHRLRILLDIANGLQYLHSFQIVHGDLNTNNVLLDADYSARLVDFGYASLVGNIPEAMAYLQRSTARPGALRWAAPEQVDPDETLSNRTTKTDIYSFGCVALQILSGKQPWSEVREDAAVVLRLAKGRKPGRPESRAMDDSHWDLVQDCWSSSEERPTAEAVTIAIQRFLNNCPPFQPLCDALMTPSTGVDVPVDVSEAWCSLSADVGAPVVDSGVHVDHVVNDGARPRAFTKENLLALPKNDDRKYVAHLNLVQQVFEVPRLAARMLPLSNGRLDEAVTVGASSSSSVQSSNDDGWIGPLSGSGLSDEQYRAILKDLVSEENTMSLSAGASEELVASESMEVPLGISEKQQSEEANQIREGNFVLFVLFLMFVFLCYLRSVRGSTRKQRS